MSTILSTPFSTLHSVQYSALHFVTLEYTLAYRSWSGNMLVVLPPFAGMPSGEQEPSVSLEKLKIWCYWSLIQLRKGAKRTEPYYTGYITRSCDLHIIIATDTTQQKATSLLN